jgi:hypothetical protein
MEQYKRHLILLVFISNYLISSCLAQSDDFEYLFPFVSKDLRISKLNDWDKGTNRSVLTNKNLKYGVKYKDHVRGIALTNLAQVEVDGLLLGNFQNLEILTIEVEKLHNYNNMLLNEMANQNLSKIAEGLGNLKNLKYVMVVGSNEALNRALSNLDSLKTLFIYNSFNSFQGEGNWKSLTYLSYVGKSENIDLSKMFKLDSIHIGPMDQSNVFASLPENSIQKVSFSGDPRKLDYSVFNPKTFKALYLDISDEKLAPSDIIELNLVGLDSLKELKIGNTRPIKWGKVSLPYLEKLCLKTTWDPNRKIYYPTEFPFFIKTLSNLKSMELDLYTDYVPKKGDFPMKLTNLKLRLRRTSNIQKISFLKDLSNLNHLELELYPLQDNEYQKSILELKGDCWLSKKNIEMDLSLRGGVELKHLKKIIKKANISNLGLETIQVRKYLEQLCMSNSKTIHVYYSQNLKPSNELELVHLTDLEIERLKQCLGQRLTW